MTYTNLVSAERTLPIRVLKMTDVIYAMALRP